MSASKLAKEALTKSTTLEKEASPASAVAPKRERGKVRVAAILAAGAAVFAEKSYDGATMTEIAARADTAIGSLYRFFPTKGALADVLLANYKTQLNDGLDALIASVKDRGTAATPKMLALALIDLMLSLRSNKDGVMAALEGRGDALALRIDIREGMRQRLTDVLAAATGMPSARARICAGMLQHVLKTVTPLAEEDEAGNADKADKASNAGNAPDRCETRSTPNRIASETTAPTTASASAPTSASASASASAPAPGSASAPASDAAPVSASLQTIASPSASSLIDEVRAITTLYLQRIFGEQLS